MKLNLLVEPFSDTMELAPGFAFSVERRSIVLRMIAAVMAYMSITKTAIQNGIHPAI